MAATTSIGQRFTQLIQQLGLSKNAFAMSLDKTATVIQHLVDERNKPGYDLICKVFETYPNVSKDWLLLGQGPMLLSGEEKPAGPEAPVSAPVPAPAVTVAPVVPVVATPTLFASVVASQPEPVAPAPVAPPVVVAAPVAVAPLVAGTSPPVVLSPAAAAQPEPAPPQPVQPAASLVVAPPPVPDAAYLTAALHAQYLQHQLDLAEQRNQHLLQQQQLMQQMLDLLKRPA